MLDNPMMEFKEFWTNTFMHYTQNPWNIITLVIDLVIVSFLIYAMVKILKGSRAMQLVKGIIFLLLITWASSIFNLKILNYLLTTVMTYGVILLIILFQPELRRALEQLGSSNKLTRYFGLDKDIISKTKEDIYKIGIAVMELSKTKTGALIVIERDIRLKEIISTGVTINGEISPQLLVNIFTPNTPLHDGAVIISENKISAAACMLPLASDGDIARELGTRHRAAIGMSEVSDALVIVVSEETGIISFVEDGKIKRNLNGDKLSSILLRSLDNNREKIKIAKAKDTLEKEK